MSESVPSHFFCGTEQNLKDLQDSLERLVSRTVYIAFRCAEVQSKKTMAKTFVQRAGREILIPV